MWWKCPLDREKTINALVIDLSAREMHAWEIHARTCITRII